LFVRKLHRECGLNRPCSGTATPSCDDARQGRDRIPRQRRQRCRRESGKIYTNPNVQFLQPTFGYFVTELNYDKLTITSPSTISHTYSGSVNSSTATPLRLTEWWSTGASGYVDAEWISDGSIASSLPPNVQALAPQCKTTQNTIASNTIVLGPNTRVDGLLVKTDDVIYMSVTQPANRPMVIRQDTLSAGNDFDLFVSTITSVPDNSSWQWRGYSSQSNEAVFIPANGSVRTLYIGVHSYSGSGQFALSADVVKSPVGAGICVTSDPAQTAHVTLSTAKLDALRAYLRSGAAYLYAYTNGIAWRDSYSLNTTWSGTCVSVRPWTPLLS